MDRASIAALRGSVTDYAGTVVTQSDKVDGLQKEMTTTQAIADSVDTTAKNLVFQPIADEAEKKHDEEKKKLKEIQTELTNQNVALASAEAQAKFAGTANAFDKLTNPKSSSLEKWQL